MGPWGSFSRGNLLEGQFSLGVIFDRGSFTRGDFPGGGQLSGAKFS